MPFCMGVGTALLTAGVILESEYQNDTREEVPLWHGGSQPKGSSANPDRDKAPFRCHTTKWTFCTFIGNIKAV